MIYVISRISRAYWLSIPGTMLNYHTYQNIPNVINFKESYLFHTKFVMNIKVNLPIILNGKNFSASWMVTNLACVRKKRD